MYTEVLGSRCGASKTIVGMCVVVFSHRYTVELAATAGWDVVLILDTVLLFEPRLKASHLSRKISVYIMEECLSTITRNIEYLSTLSSITQVITRTETCSAHLARPPFKFLGLPTTHRTTVPCTLYALHAHEGQLNCQVYEYRD